MSLEYKIKQSGLYFDTEEYPGEYRIVVSGMWNEYQWCIVSMGSHPDAYIGIPKEHHYGRKFQHAANEEDIEISVHGGITYTSNCLDVYSRDQFHHGYIIRDISVSTLDPIPDPKKYFWIGWDYGHLGDLYYSKGFPYRKDPVVWTEDMILTEIYDALKQLEEYKFIHG